MLVYCVILYFFFYKKLNNMLRKPAGNGNLSDFKINPTKSFVKNIYSAIEKKINKNLFACLSFNHKISSYGYSKLFKLTL